MLPAQIAGFGIALALELGFQRPAVAAQARLVRHVVLRRNGVSGYTPRGWALDLLLPSGRRQGEPPCRDARHLRAYSRSPPLRCLSPVSGWAMARADVLLEMLLHICESLTYACGWTGVLVLAQQLRVI